MSAGVPIVRQVVTFGRCLREAGLEVGPGRLADALTGLTHVDVTRPDDVYWTLRATLVTRAEEVEPFDRAFRAWFLRRPSRADGREAVPPPARRVLEQQARADRGAPAEDGQPHEIGWSAHEVLRQKDFAAMTPEELARLRVLLDDVAARRPLRRSRRLRPHHRGRVLDLRRVARLSLATGGDPLERAFRRRSETPRKLVVLCDISGSMEKYSRALLLFLHAAVGSGRRVEVFAFGTRLTHLTADLATRDPEKALAAAGDRVVDWAAGTRIGDSVKAYNDVWGRRALTRGAVVVVVSDGWDRGDPALVGREMARLARAAYAVVWVNPLKGHPAYQPLAGGMQAALPHVDRFVAGHNLASLEELADVLAGIERRHAA
ncbi:MAG TPA: VWA domain-containing protein [Gaiellaceae bacterium]|nr:VWA domain-containing protein [Gaiellaceae bacterium]